MQRSEVANYFVGDYAGCNARAMMEELSNEDFSKAWKKDSQTYKFTYDDVKFEMEESCPIRDDLENTQSESYKKHIQWMETLDDVSRKEEEKKSSMWIKKLKKIQIYQLRFLNKEFTALKEE